MSLFVCEQCRTIENTALSDFWLRKTAHDDKRALCSACRTGRWHGRFERRTYDGTQRVQWVDGKWLDALSGR